MRRFALFLGSLSFALILSLASHAPHLAAAPVPKHLMPKDPPPFDYPTEVGTTWVYDLGGKQEAKLAISKVESKDGNKLVTTEWIRADGRSHHMTVSIRADGVFLVAEGGRTYQKPWCLFKLPHKEGDTWSTEGHGADMKAGPVEKVQTTAGEIVACRVDWPIGAGKATYWYASGYGLVRMDGGVLGPLKSFTRGKE